MTDHYAKSVELLDAVDRLVRDLDREYAGPNRPHKVGDLHGRIGRCLKRSAIHADLAVAQQLRAQTISLADIAGRLDQKVGL